MLVANTKEAVDLVTDIFEIWPELMAQAHLKECDSGGLFVGENLFHVLAVNAQQEALCKLIQHAYDTLPRELLSDCFTSQARVLGLPRLPPPPPPPPSHILSACVPMLARRPSAHSFGRSR
jgi:hypothetical protein